MQDDNLFFLQYWDWPIIYRIFVESLIYVFYLAINKTTKYQHDYISSHILNELHEIENEDKKQEYVTYAKDANIRINVIVSTFGAMVTSVVILFRTQSMCKLAPFILFPLVIVAYFIAIRLPAIRA
jgi:hypothetical protein